MSAPAAALSLSVGERETLERLARAQAAPHRQVLRARVLLMAADGVANAVIAEEVRVTPGTVRSWRTGFAADGLAGMDKHRPRPGPQTLDRGTIAEIVRLDHHDHTAGCHALVAARWARAGVSPATVQRTGRSGFGAASGRDVQGIQRSEVRRQTHRRGRPVLEPAGEVTCCAWTRSPRSRL